AARRAYDAQRRRVEASRTTAHLQNPRADVHARNVSAAQDDRVAFGDECKLAAFRRRERQRPRVKEPEDANANGSRGGRVPPPLPRIGQELPRGSTMRERYSGGRTTNAPGGGRAVPDTSERERQHERPARHRLLTARDRISPTASAVSAPV